jgi:demethylmenaquinone methyltransferase/2-methoxy-6-polyprenyl-1,4-benzoquinol methylase
MAPHHASNEDLYAFFDALAPRWYAMRRDSSERAAHLTRLLDAQRALLADVQHIVDIGTGTGALLPHLERLAPGARVAAIDLSADMLRLARANGHAGGPCCWLRADAHHMPAATGWADLVTCHDSFAHLEDRPLALREFRRVLVPGGRLLILHDISREQVNAIHTQAANPRIHTHTLPPVGELVALVEAAGFKVLDHADAPDHYLITARSM